jgi:molybdate transport system permease protein
MVQRYLENMVSKQISRGPLSGSVFFGIFWVVFGITIFFHVMLLIGLLTYTDISVITHVLREPEFHFALMFTLWTSLLATALATIFAIPCGYILSRYRLSGFVFFDTVLDIPIVLPPMVSGIALLIFFGPLFGDELTRIGIDVVFTPLGVVVAQCFIATPFAIKSFKQAFDGIDQRMEKVAQTLGYSPKAVFFKVTLPLAKNGMIAGIMMAWTRALGEFGATAMLAGITRMKTETLSIAIFLNMSIGDIQFAISTGIVMVLMAFVLLIFMKLVLRSEVKV